MGKFLKPGRLVVVTAGRFSGRKAVLLRANEEPNKERKFGHALIVGVERQPRRVTRRMGTKKIQKRSQVKAFIKFVNLNHVMPTRYRFDEVAVKEIRERVQEDALKAAETRTTVRSNLSKYLTEKYRNLPALNLTDKKGQSRFLFTKLRF